TAAKPGSAPVWPRWHPCGPIYIDGEGWHPWGEGLHAAPCLHGLGGLGMSGLFWGGMRLALVPVQILVIWSIRRHRDPSLQIDCDYPIDNLMSSLSGLTLGTAVAGNKVEVHENGA